MAPQNDDTTLPQRLLRRFVANRGSSPYPLHWITDDLAVSAAPAAHDWPAIEAQGVRAVLDLRAEAPAGTPAQSLVYRRLPIDEYGAPPSAVVLDAASWVVEQMGSAGPVLVHCREGRGRSPMVACAALIVLGYSASDAYELARRAQPRIAMSDEQVAAIEAFSALQGRSASA